ncbi:MAG: TIGR03000 domain-containing protein [Planctomycetes bacterium]|nr:TIGR03000 domain-containing protein [Planctomycetota bacterium]
MYSVVMMMALSGTPVTVDRCRGCHCGCGCYCGCYCGGCYGCWGCHGCRGYRCHGCHGCWGCYGCYGCHGCYGGYYGCIGCFGYGTVVYSPAVTTVVDTGLAQRQSQQNTATVVVTLPADAKLTINGWTSKNTTETRRFRSPPLEQGKDYYYTVRAEVVQNGQTVVQTREIAVRAGQETRVPLDFSTTAVTQNQTER